MKQLYGKLWVKCTAIALLVVFAILFCRICTWYRISFHLRRLR